jgi:anaerobic C4-dicarboxylate transporter
MAQTCFKLFTQLDQTKEKMALKWIKYIFALMVMMLHFSAICQLSDSTYQKLKKDHPYLETFDEPQTDKKQKEPVSSQDEQIDEGHTPIGNLQVISLVILAVLVVFIIIFLVQQQSKKANDKKLKVNQKLTQQLDDIQDIEQVDTDVLLDETEKIASFNSSIRVLFIELLQSYHQANIINWRPKKTNRNYLNEISVHTSHAKMVTLTSIYEKVWYGEFYISESLYLQYKTDFKSLISEIKHEQQQ